MRPAACNTQMKRLTSFKFGNSRDCMTTKKTKARARQTSRLIQTYQGVFWGWILGLSSGLDGTKRLCGAKPTKSSLSWIINDGKISI